MRIVNRKEFLSLPKGTVFAKYEPACFENLMIKDESLLEKNEFSYSTIVDAIDYDSNFIKQLELSRKHGKELKMDFDVLSRDGLFEDFQLFAVWNKEDVKQLIAKLNKCIGE